MYKLRRNFKRLSTKDKIKFVMFLPIVSLAAILDSAIDISAFILRWVFNFVRWNWRALLIVTATVAIVALPIMTIVHIDQTVHTFDGKSALQAEQYVYRNCHEMANNFIVAEDGNVRGFVRADERNIDRLIATIVEYDVQDDDMLIGWLTSFKNGDYSDAVAFHNYCWNEIGGEVGYAVSLRDRYK